MKYANLFLLLSFAVLSFSSFASGEVYEGILELCIAIHNLGEYLEAE
jgi:hypothetical protein